MQKKEHITITIADILLEYLEDADLSQNALARALGIPSTRIHEIMRNRRRITADTDLRLCKFFSKSDGFFLRIQDNLTLRKVKLEIEKDLVAIIPYSKQVA